MEQMVNHGQRFDWEFSDGVGWWSAGAADSSSALEFPDRHRAGDPSPAVFESLRAGSGVCASAPTGSLSSDRCAS